MGWMYCKESSGRREGEMERGKDGEMERESEDLRFHVCLSV